MAKTRLEIRGMSCQHCVKTVTDALTTLEGVQRVKVNLRKGEAMVRYDASYITDANLVEAITEVGFEAGTKTKPLSLRLIGSILITLLSIAGCSEMPYTGSMLTAEDVDRYVTIGEDFACLLSGDESACITLIPKTEDDSRPVIYIHPRKLIYVFYYEGVQIMRAERVMDTTEIMEQVRGPGGDDQPPGGDGGVRDDDGDGTINGDGATQQPGDGSTQKPDDGTQQPDDGSIPRSDGGSDGTQQPPPPPPSNGGNQNGAGNNGQGNNGQGNNGQGNNGQGNNGQGNNGQGNNGQGNNGQRNNGQGNNGQGNNGQGNNGQGNNGQGNNGQGNNGQGNNGQGNNGQGNNGQGNNGQGNNGQGNNGQGNNGQGNSGQNGGQNGGNNNGGNNGDGNNPLVINPEISDAHRVRPDPTEYTTTPKIGWIVWISYPNGVKPEVTSGGLDNSGFIITVLDKNGKDITDRITNSAQTEGGPGGDTLQFFVRTFLDEKPSGNPDGIDDDGVDGDTITIRVSGLRVLEATFTAPPATSQTTPLETDLR